MTVSIVIPTLNESMRITKCLQSILAQTKKPDQVIIVDDSHDETSTIIHDFQKLFQDHSIEVILMSGSHEGVAAARQLGFTQSNAAIIASLDADCVAAPNWLENLCEPIESGLAQATTGKIIMTDAPKLIRTLTEWGWYGWYYKIIQKIFRFHLFSGANGAVARKAFIKSGGFNCLKQDINELDDAELAARLHSITQVVYVPSATVFTSFRRFRQPKKAVATTFKRFVALKNISQNFITK